MTDGSPQQYDRTVAHERDVTRYRHPYPNFDYKARIEEFAKRLELTDADAAVLPNYIDLTYYTGSGQPANLYVPSGEGASAQIFVRRAMGFAKQEGGLPDDQIRQGGLSALAEYASDIDIAGETINALVSVGWRTESFFRRWDARLPAAGLIASGDTLPLVLGHAMTITGTGMSWSMPWGPSNQC